MTRIAAAASTPSAEGIFSSDPVKQQVAMTALRKHLAAEATPEERQMIAELPVAMLRDQYGISHDAILPSFPETWDEKGEAATLATGAQHGIEPAAMKEVYAHYANRFNSAGGNLANADVVAMEADARAIFKRHGVADDIVEALVTREKQRLGLT